MPYVLASCNYDVITVTYRQALTDVLLESVAKALGSEGPDGSSVTRSDIIVQWRNRDPGDRNFADIDVLIIAHAFEERIANGAERVRHVSNAVAQWCDDSELNTELGVLRGRIVMLLGAVEFAIFPERK